MKAKEVVDYLMNQGISKNDDDSKFDPKELAMGIKVEAEHADDPDAAKEIAKDHLAEFPDYYTRLAKMEKGAEKAKAEGKEKE